MGTGLISDRRDEPEIRPVPISSTKRTSMPPRTSRTILTRVLLLQGLGWFASFAVIGGASWVSVSALQEQMLADHQMIAVDVADRVDRALGRVLETLQTVVSTPRLDLADGDPAPEHQALRQALALSSRLDTLCILDATGAVIAQEPARVVVPMDLVAPLAVRALASRRPVFDLQREAASGGRLIVVAAPMGVAGAVVAVVNPLSSSFRAVLHPFYADRGGAVDLIDGDGALIASVGTEAGPAIDRRREYADLVVQRRPWHGRLDGRTPIVAGFAPLAAGPPWGLVVRQPEAIAFGAIAAWRYRLWMLGPVLAGLAALFAWGTARSVRRALNVLTRAAERIAHGDLDRPVPPLPDDEVGRLGHAFEEMRIALRKSRGLLEDVNQALEQRVAERTRELEEVCLRLRDREQWRSQLLRKFVSVQEDERRRIARELHDDTCQALAALSVGVETAIPGLPAGDARDRLLALKKVVVAALAELHRVILDLRPSVLDDLGLRSAIQWYAEHRLAGTGIAVRCEFSGFERRFAPEVEIAVFRVVQEAISNIERHAHADAVLIQGVEREGLITIEIEDDGCGFDAGALKPTPGSLTGLGLLGMRERVELLGGSLLIDSAPGQGVHIAVTVPVGTEERPADAA